jgi:exodeoxyribonuclease VII large subunit
MFQNFFNEKSFWVIADVTGHNYYPDKGQHWFTLVEKDESGNTVLAELKAVAWRPGTERISQFEQLTGQRFGNNIHVLVKVSVEYQSRYGLKLIVKDINAEFTIGKLEQERQATLKRLVTECPDTIQKHGDEYRSFNKKLTHRAVIQRIALVGSIASAGYQDFIHTLGSNQFGYQFKVDTYYGSVQGEANAVHLSSRLTEICHHQQPYDAVVIVRGGGADTDFLIFNQFELCRQIAAFPIPVITGIGHLKNESIVDMLAHTNTKTPTKAAEYIIAHNKKFEDAIMDLQSAMIIKVQTILKSRQEKLNAANHFIVNITRDIVARSKQAMNHINTTVINRSRDILNKHKDANARFNQVLLTKTTTILYQNKSTLVEISHKLTSKPTLVVNNKLNDLENVKANLSVNSRKYLINKKGYVSHFETLIRAYSPINILKKGFAIIYQQGKIMTDGNNVDPAMDIKIRMADTEIITTPKSKTQIDGNDEFNI